VELTRSLDAAQKEDLRGFQLAISLDPTLLEAHPTGITPQILTPPELEQLRILKGCAHLSDQILSVDRVSLRGVCYGTNGSRYYRDSAIIFRLASDPPRNLQFGRVGLVERIFKHVTQTASEATPSITWYLTVKEYSRVNRPNFLDPYLRYGFAAGFLCDSDHCTTHVIELCCVECHYVRTWIPTAQAYHILPMDLVRFHINCMNSF